MKINNEINVRIVKAKIEHMRRFQHKEEHILDELKQNGYQVETIMRADYLTRNKE